MKREGSLEIAVDVFIVLVIHLPLQLVAPHESDQRLVLVKHNLLDPFNNFRHRFLLLDLHFGTLTILEFLGSELLDDFHVVHMAFFNDLLLDILLDFFLLLDEFRAYIVRLS